MGCGTLRSSCSNFTAVQKYEYMTDMLCKHNYKGNFITTENSI